MFAGFCRQTSYAKERKLSGSRRREFHLSKRSMNARFWQGRMPSKLPVIPPGTRGTQNDHLGIYTVLTIPRAEQEESMALVGFSSGKDTRYPR